MKGIFQVSDNHEGIKPEELHEHFLKEGKKKNLGREGLPIFYRQQGSLKEGLQKRRLSEPESCPHSRKVVLGEQMKIKISLKYTILTTTWLRKLRSAKSKEYANLILFHKRL